jgi:hypothetical protein
MISFDAYVDEMCKLSGYGKDFAAGIDPFGTWTSGYGQKAQQHGASEAKHRKKKMMGTAGGLVGGATVVPSAIMGTIKGVKGFAAGKGIGGRLAGAARGFVEGVKQPIKQVVQGRRAVKALKRGSSAKKAIKLTGKERKALEYAGRTSNVGAEFMPKDMKKSLGDKLYPDQAKKLAPSAKGFYREGVSQLGLGGAIGGGGAYVQYEKGRESERGFSKRLKKARR